MFERLENSYLILHFLLHNQNTTLNCPYASLIPLLFYKWLFLGSVTHSPRPLCAVRCFRRLQEISTWLFLQLIEVLPHWSGLFFFKSSMAVLLQVSFGRSLFFFPRGVHLSAILGSELGGGGASSASCLYDLCYCGHPSSFQQFFLGLFMLFISWYIPIYF